jgi:SAM-dependent methyltransferase
MSEIRLSIDERARAAIPKPVKVALRPVLGLFTDKYDSEIGWWRNRHRLGGFESSARYERIMLAMLGAPQASLQNKIVADFGCGPQGSLSWLQGAAAKIGIDVLSQRYAEEFPEDILAHDMIYVSSTEVVIPLPSKSVDVMFTMNAIDHTANLEAMCGEIVRVIKPGGTFAGAFNLNEPATYAEPQTLTDKSLEAVLLGSFQLQSRRFGRSNDELAEGMQIEPCSEPCVMWFRGTKAPE